MADPWIEGVVVAWLLAGVLRATGAAVREVSNILFEFGGWVLCALAAWMVAATAGAWVPLWLILILGVGGALIGRLVDHSGLRSGADALFLMVALLASWSSVDVVLAGFAVVAYVFLGLLIDRGAKRLPQWLAAGSVVVPVLLLGVGLTVAYGPLMSGLWKADKTFPLYLGVAVSDAGEPIRLDGGDVAWMLRPDGGAPKGGVLLLHGADPAGSHQRAAFMLQRALVQSGYMVLSLDHPGYGTSPPPEKGQPVSSWNPLPPMRAAYNLLERRLPQGTPLIVMGHSMGASGVLQLLGAEADPTFAVIMGGSMPDPPERHEYWYQRFHQDRGIEWRLPTEKWKRIKHRYYNNRTLVDGLSEDHSPILFAQFEVEWSNVRSQRSELWESIPGRKRRIELDAMTHYLNSFYLEPPFIRRSFDGGLFVGDIRNVSRIPDLLSGFDRSHRSDHSEKEKTRP